ncbi:hypothetical protein SNEBB_005476 [Seison nebaliae]|nr:hypothetical protein SNEBB_005476 [Seison nebaliae]
MPKFIPPKVKGKLSQLSTSSQPSSQNSLLQSSLLSFCEDTVMEGEETKKIIPLSTTNSKNLKRNKSFDGTKNKRQKMDWLEHPMKLNKQLVKNVKVAMDWLNNLKSSVDTWVQCEKCEKWRLLEVSTDETNADPSNLLERTVCKELGFRHCRSKETPCPNEEEFIDGPFQEGVLVWAYYSGIFRPAIIDYDIVEESAFRFKDRTENLLIPGEVYVSFIFYSKPISKWISIDHLHLFREEYSSWDDINLTPQSTLPDIDWTLEVDKGNEHLKKYTLPLEGLKETSFINLYL